MDMRRRQYTAGWTLEDLELLLQPMAEDGKEAVGSMGDDTPLAVLSSKYRGLHHFFRQNFSQVTNPPIDSLRERHVMTLGTRLGNLGNILDESPEQCDHLLLNSPVLTTAEEASLRHWLEGDGGLGARVAVIDVTVDAGLDAKGFQHAIDAIERTAEEAVRGGAEHLILDDRKTAADRMAIPSILAVAAVHAHLARKTITHFYFNKYS